MEWKTTSSDSTRRLRRFVFTDYEDPYEQPRTPAKQTSTSDDIESASKLLSKKNMSRYVRNRQRHRQRLVSPERAIQCSMTLHDALNRGTSSAEARQRSRASPRLGPKRVFGRGDSIHSRVAGWYTRGDWNFFLMALETSPAPVARHGRLIPAMVAAA